MKPGDKGYGEEKKSITLALAGENGEVKEVSLPSSSSTSSLLHLPLPLLSPPLP